MAEVPYGWRTEGPNGGVLICNFSCGCFYRRKVTSKWYRFNDIAGTFGTGWFVGPRGGVKIWHLREFEENDFYAQDEAEALANANAIQEVNNG